MANRLLFGMNMAQYFFFHLSLSEKCSDQEETLFRYYIDIVSTILKTTQKKVNILLLKLIFIYLHKKLFKFLLLNSIIKNI